MNSFAEKNYSILKCFYVKMWSQKRITKYALNSLSYNDWDRIYIMYCNQVGLR